MQMMHVRHVWVPVPHLGVTMRMGMRLSWWVAGRMLVLMVRIMDVRMTVLHRLMFVLVFMVFCEV